MRGAAANGRQTGGIRARAAGHRVATRRWPRIVPPATGRVGGRRGTRLAARRGALAALLPLVVLAAGGCEVDWGGARLELEDPAPPPPEPEAPEATREERPEPLPSGPLLYAIRPTADGAALVTPVAALPPEGGAPVPLELPEPLPDEFRARFDSAFLRPGSELAVQRWGRRIGSVVLGGAREPADPACPSVADGILLLPPGQEAPRTAPALAPELSPSIPERVASLEPVRGMTRAAPVLAERLIGGDRAFLARRVSLQAIRIAGDTAPAMAVTYLIDDSLAAGPPAGEAISLFYLAGYEPARGYVTRWSELRRYEAAEEKEAYEYLDWARTPGGRLHLLRLYGGGSVRLAGAFVPEGGDEGEARVEWREPDRCPTLARLGVGR